MYHVYLLRSTTQTKKTYVGFTEKDPAVPDKFKALALERYFKSGSGHAFARRHLW